VDGALYLAMTDLDLKVATLEERIEIRQAQYEGALERLRSDMERWRADIAKRDTEAAKRDTENTRWQIGLWVAAVVVLGILIRWPAPPAP